MNKKTTHWWVMRLQPKDDFIGADGGKKYRFEIVLTEDEFEEILSIVNDTYLKRFKNRLPFRVRFRGQRLPR